MGGQPASLNPDPSLKKRRVGIAALLALALALIGYVTVEINHKARLFGQPAAEESLGAFRQLSVQYAFLVLSAHQASSNPVSELKRLRKEFKSFHSKSELLSASQYYQDLPRTHPLKLNINKVQKFLFENAPLIEQSNAQLKTTLPNLVKDLRNLQTPIKIISEAPANSLIASPQAESALTPWIYLRLALLTILAGFSISLAAILIARQRATRATPSAKKDTQIPRPESLAASAHDAVLNLSKDGIITEYKNNAEPMFGYTKEEALERNIEDLLIPPKLLNRYRKELKPFALSPIATPEPAQRFKAWLQRKSGETFPAEISFQPIAPEARSRISVVIRDLTQEKAKQKNPANATVVNFGVSFLHLRVTENTEKPIDDVIPKTNPIIVFCSPLPIAIIKIPNAAINIEIQTLKDIFSFKNKKANKAVKKGIAAKHNKVIAALVFVIEYINEIIAIPRPTPPKRPDLPIFL